MDKNWVLYRYSTGGIIDFVDCILGRFCYYEFKVSLLRMTQKIKIIYIALLFTAAIAIPLLYFFVYPLYAAYFPKCIFYLTTGLYCPGCGSQRAFVALLHGDILTAIHDNFLAVILLPFLLYALFVFFYNQFSSKKINKRIFYSSLSAKLILVLVITFAVLRNIPFYPFTLLAPL